LPELNINHLKAMTDDTGMLQHAIFTVPNRREGYTTDDNARALIFTVLVEYMEKEWGGQAGLASAKLPHLYLSFLGHAFNPETRRFKNFLSYDRHWNETEGSEDCHGRALWALGTVLGRSEDQGCRGVAGRLFEFSLPQS